MNAPHGPKLQYEDMDNVPATPESSKHRNDMQKVVPELCRTSYASPSAGFAGPHDFKFILGFPTKIASRHYGVAASTTSRSQSLGPHEQMDLPQRHDVASYKLPTTLVSSFRP